MPASSTGVTALPGSIAVVGFLTVHVVFRMSHFLQWDLIQLPPCLDRNNLYICWSHPWSSLLHCNCADAQWISRKTLFCRLQCGSRCRRSVVVLCEHYSFWIFHSTIDTRPQNSYIINCIDSSPVEKRPHLFIIIKKNRDRSIFFKKTKADWIKDLG